MPNVIKSLLVGIGFDIDKKSKDGVEGAFDMIASKATKIGAVVAGALGIKGIGSMTSELAKLQDDLGKFANRYGMDVNQINALGGALGTENGSLQELISELQQLYDLQNKFRLRGSAGFMEDFGIVGVSGDQIDKFLKAKDAVQAYLQLANIMQSIPQNKRVELGHNLGLGDASIALMSSGGGSVSQLMKQFESMRPLTEEMAKNAAEFNTNMHILNTNIKGLSDLFANPLIKAGADAARRLNDFLNENHDAIGGKISSESNGLVFLYDLFTGNEMDKWRNNTIAGVKVGSIFDTAHDIYYFNPFGASAEPDAPDPYLTGNSYTGVLNRAGVDHRAPDSPQKIQVDLHLDSKVIDSRIIDVTEQQNRNAIEELSNSEGG